MKLQIRNITFGLICLFAFSGLSAQVIAPAVGKLPPGVTPADIPPEYKDRILKMRSEGKSETEIMQVLGDEMKAKDEGGIQSTSGNDLTAKQNEPASPPPATAPEVVNLQNVDPNLTPAEMPAVETVQSVTTLPRYSIPGSELKENPSEIFGHHIFKQVQAETFFQANRITPHNEYVIGPGDRIDVTVWGDNELSESLYVLPDGTVSRAYLGKIHVSGLTFGEVKELLAGRYRRGLVSGNPSTNIEITLAETKRTLNVNIVGQVNKPGAYQVSSASTALFMLYLAGGVTDFGTVRNIQIKRDDKVVQVLDLYDYLIKGEDKPVYLQENDFIFVPVQGKVVSISGAVRRPMRYELKEDENLRDLLRFAEGLPEPQVKTSGQLIRQGIERESYYDFSLDSLLAIPKSDMELQHLDILRLRQLTKPIENFVQATGMFQFPGKYAYEPGERVSGLIKRTGGFVPQVYLRRAYVVRIIDSSSQFIYIPIDLQAIVNGTAGPDEDILLEKRDAMLVFSNQQFIDRKTIAVQGQVRKPGVFPILPGMTLKDLIYLAGGLTQDADSNNLQLTTFTQPMDVAATTLQAEQEAAGEAVEVPEVDEDKKSIRRISITGNWQTDPLLDTVMVEGFNSLRIFSRYDFLSFRFLEVDGEVKNSIRIQKKTNMSLRDVLYLAGGLTDKAYTKEIELYREIEVEERGNFNLSSPRREVIRVRINEDWREDPVTDSIKVAGFRKIHVRSEDEFFKKTYVDVKGMVGSPGRVELMPNMSLRDLIYTSGGLKLGADVTRIEITHVILVEDADGTLQPVPVNSQWVSTIQNWQQDSKLDEVKLKPYDQVFVRKDVNFKLQESVYVLGEVHIPGEYNKVQEKERLSSLVGRAGGVTELAYLKGAKLDRRLTGVVAINLEKAVRRQGSRHDIILQAGDSIIIPPRVDVVRVDGNVLQPGTVLFFDPNHRHVKYYINQAGGFDKKTKKKMLTVKYVDGRLRRTKTFWGFKDYPRVDQGAMITVNKKPAKEKKPEQGEKQTIDINWTQITASVISVLTLYILFRNASNG